MSAEKLAEVGKGLGLQGGELVKWIEQQQEVDRVERAARREAEKDEAERKAREAEAERKEREAEAERKEREAERKEREAERDRKAKEAERELQVRKDLEMKKLELEHERKLKGVEEKQGAPAGREGERGVQGPKLPVFVDGKDDLDSYLERFERFARTRKWAKEEWASNLSALLTGRALDVYARLSAEEAENYDKLKEAVLGRYRLNAEGFRLKLRDSVAEEGESPAQFIERLKGYVNKWVELSKVEKSVKGLVGLIVGEQFVATCSSGLATFLTEHSVKDLAELGQVASRFLEARGKSMKEQARGCRKALPGEWARRSRDNVLGVWTGRT